MDNVLLLSNRASKPLLCNSKMSGVSFFAVSMGGGVYSPNRGSGEASAPRLGEKFNVLRRQFAKQRDPCEHGDDPLEPEKRGPRHFSSCQKQNQNQIGFHRRVVSRLLFAAHCIS